MATMGSSLTSEWEIKAVLRSELSPLHPYSFSIFESQHVTRVTSGSEHGLRGAFRGTEDGSEVVFASLLWVPRCAGSRIVLELQTQPPAPLLSADPGFASSWKSWLPSLRAASRLLPAAFSLSWKRAQLLCLRSPSPRKHREGTGRKGCPPALSGRRGAAASPCS